MTDKAPQKLPEKPGEPGGEKATAKKLVSKLREAGLDNIKIQEAADERFIPTAYDSMRQAFNTRMDDLEAGVVGALAACALEARLDEAVDWRDAAVSLTRSAHEKWMESRLTELRLERAAEDKA